MGQKEDAFYIRQPDALPGQFLMVDDKITAVLDWELFVSPSSMSAIELTSQREHDL
jgi:hypothetical protein